MDGQLQFSSLPKISSSLFWYFPLFILASTNFWHSFLKVKCTEWSEYYRNRPYVYVFEVYCFNTVYNKNGFIQGKYGKHKL